MKRVEFEGRIQEFPDDATDDEIRSALETSSPTTVAAPAAQPAERPGFFQGVGEGSSILQAVRHPIDTIGGIIGAQDIQEAARYYQNGDMKGAATKMIQWAAMGGPVSGVRVATEKASKEHLDRAREEFKKGNYGGVLKNITQAVVPPAASLIEGTSQLSGDNPAYGAGLVAGNLLDAVAPIKGTKAAKAAGRAAGGTAKGALGVVTEAALSPTGRDVIGMVSPRAGRAVDAIARVKEGVSAIQARRAAAHPPALPVSAPQVQSGPPPIPVQPPPIPAAAAPIAEPLVTPATGVADDVIRGAGPEYIDSFAKSMLDRGVDPLKARAMKTEDWSAAAKEAGVGRPSAKTQGEILFRMRKIKEEQISPQTRERLRKAGALSQAEELASLLAE